MSIEILVSPSARRLAAEKGVDLASIRGTGPNGRIVKADIEAAPANRQLVAEAESSDHLGAVAPAVAKTTDDEIKASPLAKRIAAELGVELATVKGTGPNGRVVKEDVEAVAGSAPAKAALASTDTTPSASTSPSDGGIPHNVVKLSNMRMTI